MANAQPAYDPTDMTGLYQALMQGVDPNELPPVPEDGPYGAPATERDTGPQSANPINPLAVALSGGMPGGPSTAPSAPPPQDQGQSPGFASMLASALAAPSTGSRYNPQTGEFLPSGSYPAPSPQPAPASPAASPAGAQDIAGKASDMAGEATAEDATTAAYRALHDEKAAEYQRNRSLAAQTAQSNPEISAQYLKAAQDNLKLMNDISLLSIKHNEPAADTGEIKNWEYAQTHQGFPMPGAANLELKEVGQDPFGNKSFVTFNPKTGEIKPYTPPGGQTSGGAAAVPAQLQQLDMPNADAGQGDKTPAVPLPPDQQSRLGAVNPAIRGTVESILQGRLGLPKITSGRGAQLPLAITQAVISVNPDFDANTNQNQLLARKAFNAGGSNNTPGQLILNSDAALDHFEPLVRASDALPNYGSIVGGAVGETARATGGYLGGDYQNKAAALLSAATPASAETMKYLAGTTGGGEGEREQLIKSFSDVGGTPQSRRELIVNYIDDMLAKKAELQTQWHTAMGPNAPDFPVISDSARAAVVRMGYGGLLQKYGLQGGGEAPAPQGGVGAPTAPSVPVGGTIPGTSIRRVK